MKVSELYELLSNYPEDMEIAFQIHSDYDHLDAASIEVKTLVDKGYYLMRSHDTMSDGNKATAKEYLCFPGN